MCFANWRLKFHGLSRVVQHPSACLGQKCRRFLGLKSDHLVMKKQNLWIKKCCLVVSNLVHIFIPSNGTMVPFDLYIVQPSWKQQAEKIRACEVLRESCSRHKTSILARFVFFSAADWPAALRRADFVAMEIPVKCRSYCSEQNVINPVTILWWYDIIWYYTVDKSRLHHAPSGFLWVLIHIPRRNAVVCPTYLCLLRWLPRCSRHCTGAVAANATMLRRSHRSWSTHSKRGRGICASHSETWSCQELPGLAMPGVSFGRSNKVWTELWKLIASSNCI